MKTQIAQLLRMGSKAHNNKGKLVQRKMQDKDLMVGLQNYATLWCLERAAKQNNCFHLGSLFPPAILIQLAPSS